MYESPPNRLMLLSSAKATPDAPSASAAAAINCLLREYCLRDMACSFNFEVPATTVVSVHIPKPFVSRQRRRCCYVPAACEYALPIACMPLHRNEERQHHHGRELAYPSDRR